jgi:hypothetical protein
VKRAAGAVRGIVVPGRRPPSRVRVASAPGEQEHAGDDARCRLGVYPTEQSTIDRLHELIAGFPEYDGYEATNRPVQPLNGRVIENDTP